MVFTGTGTPCSFAKWRIVPVSVSISVGRLARMSCKVEELWL